MALDNSRNANLLTNTAIQTIVAANFSQISAENNMKMSYYNETTFANAEAEQMISWANQNNIGVHGHALVWHPDYQLPSWARTPDANFRARFEAHVRGVARKHRGQLESWDVVNEALSDGGEPYRDSVFYRQYNGIDYIANAFRWAREEDPDVDLYYNDYNTEANGAKTQALVTLISELLSSGVPIDGVGFQMHVLPDWPSITDIRASWRAIMDLDPNLKIKLTELDVRTNNAYSDPPRVEQSCDSSCLQQQKQRYKSIIAAYLTDVPAARRGGITVWGVADNHSWYSDYEENGLQMVDWPLLWNSDLQTKPAYDGVWEALQGL